MKYNAKDLRPTLQKWARRLGDRARKFAPKHIREAKMIHSHLNFEDESSFQISLVTDPPKGDAENVGGKVGGDIFGREFGAGVHGTPPKKYPIYPRNKKVLAFKWEKANKSNLGINIANRIYNALEVGSSPAVARQDSSFYGFSDTDDRLLFNYVTHPGYVAWNGGRGFLGLAFEQIQKEIEEDDEMSRKMTNIVTDAIDDGILEMNTKGGFNVRIR